MRAAIADSYWSKYALEVEARDVVATTGSSGGFLLAFLACFDVGDRVAIASPGYPCYRNILSALGCEVVELPCGPRDPFPADGADAGRTRSPPCRGRCRGESGEPDRHGDPSRRTRGDRVLVRGVGGFA